MSKKTAEIRKKIKESEEKLNRELTEKEKRSIAKKVVKKYKRRNFIRATLLLIGLGGAVTAGTKLLPEGKGPQIESEVDLNNSNANTFREGLKVQIGENNASIEENEEFKELENQIREEIKGLSNKDEVLKYIKQIYADEFNENNSENIVANDVVLYRTKVSDKMYKDYAENGDKIVRYGSYESNKEEFYSQSGLITATVIKDNDIKTEAVSGDNGFYQKVYKNGEVVPERDEDSSLLRVAPVIDKGISYATSFDNENIKFYVRDTYRDKLIDAVIEYKENKAIENQQKEEQKKAIGQIGQAVFEYENRSLKNDNDIDR